MRTNTLQPNFVGGELSKRLLGRSDIERFSTGGELVENFRVRIQGPLVRRKGAAYTVETGCAITRLHTFAFSRTDSVLVLFGCDGIVVAPNED